MSYEIPSYYRDRARKCRGDRYSTRTWELTTSICPRCLAEVSNKAYFAGPKGSAHFRGTCQLKPWRKPEQFDLAPPPIPKPYNAAWIGRVDYSRVNGLSDIHDRASFEAFWGFNKPAKRRIKKAA